MNQSDRQAEICRKTFEEWIPIRRAQWRSIGVELSDADVNSMWEGFEYAWNMHLPKYQPDQKSELVDKLEEAAFRAERCHLLSPTHIDAIFRALNIIAGIVPLPCWLRKNQSESGWILKEDFRGEPNTSPLVWWWWSAAPEATPELDEIILDAEGKICGKGECGADYYSHVKLANIERPKPPAKVTEGNKS